MSRRMIILTEGHTEPNTAKTAASLVRYCRDEVVALLDSTQAGKTVGELLGVGGSLPVVARLDQGADADTLAIGVAPHGGRLPAAWRATLLEAIERGMNVLSGLHDFLSDDAELAAAAERRGVTIHDVRKNNERQVARGLGLRDGCLRIHTVGNDCSVGKLVASIEVARGLREAGRDARFVATGQTGIMIAGAGCPIDGVVGDFISGAAERLVLDNQQHDILLIEGQGSLLHPSYSAVTTGLLHGCAPHGLILCYEAGRRAIHELEHVALPPLKKVRELYETLAAARQPARVIGVAMNGRRLSAEEASAERRRVEEELGVPACDIFRDGPGPLVEAVVRLRQELPAQDIARGATIDRGTLDDARRNGAPAPGSEIELL